MTYGSRGQNAVVARVSECERSKGFGENNHNACVVFLGGFLLAILSIKHFKLTPSLLCQDIQYETNTFRNNMHTATGVVNNFVI